MKGRGDEPGACRQVEDQAFPAAPSDKLIRPHERMPGIKRISAGADGGRIVPIVVRPFQGMALAAEARASRQ
jgi:hypothetical protein